MSFDFHEEARASAAREYGARRYRWYAFRANLPRNLALLGSLALLGLGGWGGWAVWDRWPEWIPVILTAVVLIPLAVVVSLIVRRVRDSRW